jgi:hypothetical protein
MTTVGGCRGDESARRSGDEPRREPGIFGDDYLDGGAPTGPSDGDRVHGNNGNDTCTGAVDDGDHLTTCETSF